MSQPALFAAPNAKIGSRQPVVARSIQPRNQEPRAPSRPAYNQIAMAARPPRSDSNKFTMLAGAGGGRHGANNNLSISGIGMQNYDKPAAPTQVFKTKK